jgi:predicted dehydrogenase
MLERVLLIGLGQIGMGYDMHLPKDEVYTHARAFTLHEAFDLVAAVDPSKLLRKQFSAQYGKPAFASIEDAATHFQPTVVVIATPTSTHFSLLQNALALLNPKVILCEKPLAYQHEQAQAMVQMCQDASVKLFVNYIRRADPAIIEVKRRIESHEVMLPIKGNVWYSKGLIHNGSHFFNLIEFWLGDVIGFKLLDSGRDIESEDSEPDIYVQFEKGSVVFQSAWEEAFSYYTAELISPSGRLRVEDGGARVMWQSAVADAKLSGYRMLSPKVETLTSGMQQYQLNVAQQLALALQSKTHTLCTGSEAATTLSEILKIASRKK